MAISKIFDFICSPIFLLTTAAMILILNFTRKNNNFFDVRKVFENHFSIFRDAKGQFFVFYGTPLLLAFGIANYKLMDIKIIDNIVIVLSIIISMLFAVMSVLTSFKGKDEHYTVVLKETFNAVIFEAILCILSLLLSFSVLFVGEIETVWINYIFSLVIYYLIFTIVLNIFLVIKRIKKLFENQ